MILLGAVIGFFRFVMELLPIKEGLGKRYEAGMDTFATRPSWGCRREYCLH